MRLSARNQLTGRVKSIKEGIVTAEVVVALDGGQEVVSVITMTSVQNLKLAVESPVTVLIKSTEVMLATEG
ncbi:MAG: TOBE domain-containing protein [Caldilineaceae bacterium]|nr:TOBE domain-containing protein [Caldilineaceae bacterium]